MKHVKLFEQFISDINMSLNENSDILPIDSEIPGGEVGKFYDYLLKDYVIDFDGKYLDNGDFKPGFKKVQKADENLKEIIKDLKDRGLTLKDLPTEWTKVNTYEGQANTKYDKDGDELYHYEVEIYQFVKLHNNKLMTAEVVSKPLRKVSSPIRKRKFANENNEFYADEVLIKVVKTKKVGNDYHVESEFKFKDKKTLNLFMDNVLDNMNSDILDWAENEFNIDGADYVVDPGDMKVKGNNLVGTLKIEFVG